MDERGLSKKQFLGWFGVTVALSILIPLAWVALSEHALKSLPQPNTVGAPVTAGLASSRA